MPSDYVTDPLYLFARDPVLLIGSLLPIVVLAGLLIDRIRVSRRFTAMAKQNEEAFRQNTALWEAAAVRTEKMIELLTEIRDHLARTAPDQQGS